MALVNSSIAPLLDTLRTVQSIAPPPNSIVPPFNTRCRDELRWSSMKAKYAQIPQLHHAYTAPDARDFTCRAITVRRPEASICKP
jgi:hypothetical protein